MGVSCSRRRKVWSLGFSGVQGGSSSPPLGTSHKTQPRNSAPDYSVRALVRLQVSMGPMCDRRATAAPERLVGYRVRNAIPRRALTPKPSALLILPHIPRKYSRDSLLEVLVLFWEKYLGQETMLCCKYGKALESRLLAIVKPQNAGQFAGRGRGFETSPCKASSMVRSSKVPGSSIHG